MTAPPPAAVVPHFAAPVCRDGDYRGTPVTAVDRDGAGDLAEARLVLRLRPVPAADGRGPDTHATAVEVAAELLRVPLHSAADGIAAVRIEARPDRLVVALRVFTADLGEACRRVGAVLDDEAVFSSDAVQRAARTVARHLATTQHRPEVMARAGFLRAVYGVHPWGGQADPGAVERVQAADLVRLVCAVPRAERRVMVVGRGPATSLLRAAGPFAGSSAPESRPYAPAPAPVPPRPALASINCPGLPHTLIRAGILAPGRSDPDYPALQVAVLMLGGYFGSRLMAVLREREGLAYAPRAVLDPLGEQAAFTVEADVREDGAVRALDLVRGEIDRIAAGGFSEAELAAAQHYAVGSMALSCSSRSGLASVLAALAAGGLPTGWLKGYEQRLRAPTASRVAQAAAAYLVHPGLAGIVAAPRPSPGLPPPAVR